MVDLLAREGAGRNGMAAHEFRHNIFFLWLVNFAVAVLGFGGGTEQKKRLNRQSDSRHSVKICYVISRAYANC